jgi:hypothetical protein
LWNISNETRLNTEYWELAIGELNESICGSNQPTKAKDASRKMKRAEYPVT